MAKSNHKDKAVKMNRYQLLAPPDWAEMVDRWRATQPGLPNRSEAIRQLVELGVKANASRKASK